MSARDAILARLKGAAPDRAQADALLIAPERPAVDPAALLRRPALDTLGADHVLHHSGHYEHCSLRRLVTT